MRWEGQRQSDNVEDRRESGPSTGLGGLLGGGRRSIGIGTIVVALVGGWILGINPLTLLGVLSGGSDPALMQSSESAPASGPMGQDRGAQFVATVLADTEDVWRGLFQRQGAQYQEPKLVMFRGATPTACGMGQSAMGPFYCPQDHKVYIDLEFFETLQRDLGAPGEFARAYVIAHEVGHHVQNLMGVTDKMEQLRGRVSEVQYNRYSVKLELQADCLAGVWGHHAQNARQILEQGDIEAAMNAAARIGDDALQKRGQGQVVPESFTHGTSAQRARWFERGLQTGQTSACDTFGAQSL